MSFRLRVGLSTFFSKLFSFPTRSVDLIYHPPLFSRFGWHERSSWRWNGRIFSGFVIFSRASETERLDGGRAPRLKPRYAGEFELSDWIVGRSGEGWGTIRNHSRAVARNYRFFPPRRPTSGRSANGAGKNDSVQSVRTPGLGGCGERDVVCREKKTME